MPHLRGRDRGHAQAADRVQHPGGRRHGRAHARRACRGSSRGRVGAVPSQSSVGLPDLRQGRRVRPARLRDGVCARHLRRRGSEAVQAQGRGARSDDRPRRGAVHRLSALRSLRRYHRRRAAAGRQGARGARHHRDRERPSLPPQLHRKRDGAVSGRRADVADVPIQVAALGPKPHEDELHAVFGRVSAVRGRALRKAVAHDARGRRPHLRRLALRSRALQRRLLRIAGSADAAALPQGRRASSRSAGTTRSTYGPRRYAMRSRSEVRRVSGRSAAAG